MENIEPCEVLDDDYDSFYSDDGTDDEVKKVIINEIVFLITTLTFKLFSNVNFRMIAVLMLAIQNYQILHNQRIKCMLLCKNLNWVRYPKT